VKPISIDQNVVVGKYQELTRRLTHGKIQGMGFAGRRLEQSAQGQMLLVPFEHLIRHIRAIVVNYE
jgi:hypothetical protein